MYQLKTWFLASLNRVVFLAMVIIRCNPARKGKPSKSGPHHRNLRIDLFLCTSLHTAIFSESGSRFKNYCFAGHGRRTARPWNMTSSYCACLEYDPAGFFFVAKPTHSAPCAARWCNMKGLCTAPTHMNTQQYGQRPEVFFQHGSRLSGLTHAVLILAEWEGTSLQDARVMIQHSRCRFHKWSFSFWISWF